MWEAQRTRRKNRRVRQAGIDPVDGHPRLLGCPALYAQTYSACTSLYEYVQMYVLYIQDAGTCLRAALHADVNANANVQCPLPYCIVGIGLLRVAGLSRRLSTR